MRPARLTGDRIGTLTQIADAARWTRDTVTRYGTTTVSLTPSGSA
jgi:hypothetical protein